MWEEMKIAPPCGSKDVKGSRLYEKYGLVKRACLSSSRKFIFFSVLSVDYILAIGWICFSLRQEHVYFLQERYHCVSDMHITRFAVVLVLFFTGMYTCKYSKLVKVVKSDFVVNLKKDQDSTSFLILFWKRKLYLIYCKSHPELLSHVQNNICYSLKSQISALTDDLLLGNSWNQY